MYEHCSPGPHFRVLEVFLFAKDVQDAGEPSVIEAKNGGLHGMSRLGARSDGFGPTVCDLLLHLFPKVQWLGDHFEGFFRAPSSGDDDGPVPECLSKCFLVHADPLDFRQENLQGSATEDADLHQYPSSGSYTIPPPVTDEACWFYPSCCR
jgi:hypothetical protein